MTRGKEIAILVSICAVPFILLFLLMQTTPEYAAPKSVNANQPARNQTEPAPRSFSYCFPLELKSKDDCWYGVRHHDYPATDIFAPKGTPILAVVDGRIEERCNTDYYKAWIKDRATYGGRYVSIIGADGWRYYYSHLDSVDPSIQVGSDVRAGQVIGTLGNSGNAASTKPHLHFGISRPTYAGDWKTRRGTLLPYYYLRAWERGLNMTPKKPE